MTRNEEDEFYIARIVEGVATGITSRRRLILYTGVSESKFTRLAGRAIIAKKVVMKNESDRRGGIVFGLYGKTQSGTGHHELNGSKTAEAESFLRDTLADGPAWSSEVKRKARARGLRDGVLKTARANLGVTAVRDGSVGRWKVMLP